MYAPDLPDPWMIDELEKMRRDRWEERPAVELPLPPPMSRREERSTPRTVIVIEL
jgi:hypothetical protein